MESERTFSYEVYLITLFIAIVVLVVIFLSLGVAYPLKVSIVEVPAT